MKFVTLTNQNGKAWVSVPVLEENSGLAITPCIDSAPGKAPKRGRYYVTHIKSGRKVAGGPTGMSRKAARTALSEFLALPIDWRAAGTRILREARSYMPAINAIRERARGGASC